MTPCNCSNCEKSGGGEKLRLADGTETCSGSMRMYELLHGPMPARWLPTTPCTDPWVLPEKYQGVLSFHGALAADELGAE